MKITMSQWTLCVRYSQCVQKFWLDGYLRCAMYVLSCHIPRGLHNIHWTRPVDLLQSTPHSVKTQQMDHPCTTPWVRFAVCKGPSFHHLKKSHELRNESETLTCGTCFGTRATGHVHSSTVRSCNAGVLAQSRVSEHIKTETGPRFNTVESLTYVDWVAH